MLYVSHYKGHKIVLEIVEFLLVHNVVALQNVSVCKTLLLHVVLTWRQFEHNRKLTYRVSPGSYEGWEGGSFPCIRVKKNRDSLPRLVVMIKRITRNQHFIVQKLSDSAL